MYSSVLKWHKVPFLLDALVCYIAMECVWRHSEKLVAITEQQVWFVCVCVWMSVVKEAGTHLSRVRVRERERAPTCPIPSCRPVMW